MTIAGGAVYVTYDSGLLGSSEQGSAALEKAKAAVPPALEEWMKYFGLEVRMCKLLIWPNNLAWYFQHSIRLITVEGDTSGLRVMSFQTTDFVFFVRTDKVLRLQTASNCLCPALFSTLQPKNPPVLVHLWKSRKCMVFLFPFIIGID